MNINKDNEEMIVNFGALEYDAEKISIILGEDIEEVKKEMKNKNSDLFKLLQKGKYLAEYLIDLKLFEMAKSGDIKALDKLDSRKRDRNY